MPAPLMKYAIKKTGKGGAKDWIAYAITCKSDPRTIVCIMELRWYLRRDAHSEAHHLPSRNRVRLLDICWLQLQGRIPAPSSLY